MDDLKAIEDPRELHKAYQAQVKWREQIAGENKDALKTLERFASPKAIYESYSELRSRVAKGELKAVAPFPKTGTAEQQAAWRSENGVPEAPDKYDLNLPKGLVVGEKDKPVVEGFTKYAHEHHLPTGAVSTAMNWYFEEKVRREEAARAEFDTKKTEVAAALGAEWGPEYKTNLNKIQGLLDSTIPADQGELKTLINNAIATNAHFARHYAKIALDLNPAGVLVSMDRGANEGTVVDELTKIDTLRKTDRKKYDGDPKIQQRYLDLLDGYTKLTGKEWGRQAA